MEIMRQLFLTSTMECFYIPDSKGKTFDLVVKQYNILFAGEKNYTLKKYNTYSIGLKKMYVENITEVEKGKRPLLCTRI